MLPSETGCTASIGAGPLPTAGPGRLTNARASGQHRARTRDLVSTRLTAVEQGLFEKLTVPKLVEMCPNCHGTRRFINNS